MNATQNPAKPRAKRNPQRLFYIEVTDTMGGEANYSWVTRHIIRASSALGAAHKFGSASGYTWRKDHDTGEYARYNSQSGATCYFLSAYDHSAHANYSQYSTDERTDLEKVSAEIFQEVYEALKKRWEGAGKPVHATESILWDMERETRGLKRTRTVKDVLSEALDMLGTWLESADDVTDAERGALASGYRALENLY